MVLRLYLLAGCAAVAVLTVVLAILTATTQPIASEHSLAALSAWSAYGQAAGTLLLVLLAVPAASIAISDLRTKRRPIVSVTAAHFGAEGLQVYIENVGETAWLGVEIRAWVVHVSSARPSPVEWADALESTALAIQDGARPTFVGTFNALSIRRGREELLRWGPEASTYDPAWVGTYGILIWDSVVRDLYDRSHPGSGHTDIEPGVPSG